MPKQRMQAKSVTAVVGRDYGSRKASGSPQARLRGEFEHMSHETAVNRHMTPEAVIRRYHADIRFHFAIMCLAVLLLALLAGLLFR